MGTFDAGTLKGRTARPTRSSRTARPCTARSSATRRRAASASRSRSTARRAGASCSARSRSRCSRPGGVHSPQQFFDTMSKFELTFNWFYADSKHIAMYSSGRLPLRAPGREPRPADERQRLVRVARLARRRRRTRSRSTRRAGRSSTGTTSRRRRSRAADDNWSYGLGPPRRAARRERRARRSTRRRASSSAMNAAATQDLRRDASWPLARRGARAAPAPSARDAADARSCSQWRGTAAGSTRTSTARSTIPAPRSWTRGGRSSRSPCCSPCSARSPTGSRAARTASDDANPSGSSYGAGWYAYVDEGPPLAARRAGHGPVLDALLRRRRRSRRAARRSGQSLDAARQRARRSAGARPGRVARRRDEGADPLRPASSRTRCAGRTGRPSSRSSVFRSHR